MRILVPFGNELILAWQHSIWDLQKRLNIFLDILQVKKCNHFDQLIIANKTSNGMSIKSKTDGVCVVKMPLWDLKKIKQIIYLL